MRYRRLDENGDYSFGNNSLDYIKDNDAVVQAIKTKLYLFYGEWWEDISLGLPMFQSILGQVSNENLRRTVILLSAEQIQSVENSVGLHIKNEEITIGLVRHSTFPWSRFTGLTQPSNFGTGESIPRIIFGKAYTQNDKMYMPVSVEANHGFVDGFHLANYLQEFEKELGKY